MSITLRVLGLIGALIYGVLFSVTFLSQESIEESAKGFVKYQIEKELLEKQQLLTSSDIAVQAKSLADSLGLETEQLQKDLEKNLPEKIASVIASLCGYDCEKKKALTKSITSSYLDRIKNISIAQNTLADLIKGKYIEIVSNLKFDLRIFLGSSLLMFLILVLVSLAKPIAMAHLFLPGLLLAVSTILASAIYIFGQDWFYTILYNDYMGFSYLVYLSLIFGCLLDIAINKARVTTEVINAFFNALGSALSVSPC